MTSGICLDSSGLAPIEKRVALFEMQVGLCGACKRPGRGPKERGRRGKLFADHDHQTGLLRGLLCQSCNQREGIAGSLLLTGDYPDIAAYLAKPPAGTFGWMWDLPDWWTFTDTAAVRIRECTVLDYVMEHVASRSNR